MTKNAKLRKAINPDSQACHVDSNNRRGASIANLIVIVVAAVVAIAVLKFMMISPALSKASSSNRSAKDAWQIGRVFQAMQTFSNTDPEGSFPVPGRTNKLPISAASDGSAEERENWMKNSTGHLYSAMIALEFLAADDAISPCESNPVISAFGTSPNDASDAYDYGSYNPANDTFWMGDTPDSGGPDSAQMIHGGGNAVFRATIDRPTDMGGRGHASYAHSMLSGTRRLTTWRNTAGQEKVVLGNRGTRDGVVLGPEYDKSFALLFHGPEREWQGHVCRADGLVLYERNFFPRDVEYGCGQGQIARDNIFAAEFNECGDIVGSWNQGDAWLAMNEVVTDGGTGDPKPIAVFDFLRN